MKLTAQEQAELDEFVTTRFPNVGQVRRTVLVRTAPLYTRCDLPYISYSACSFDHGDDRLATSASRGSLVSVECVENDTHSCWYGIIRFLCNLELDSDLCVVAYVDYFQRSRDGLSSPVARHAHGSFTTSRVVPVSDIVGKVMLLPAEGRPVWLVVDGL